MFSTRRWWLVRRMGGYCPVFPRAVHDKTKHRVDSSQPFSHLDLVPQYHAVEVVDADQYIDDFPWKSSAIFPIPQWAAGVANMRVGVRTLCLFSTARVSLDCLRNGSQTHPDPVVLAMVFHLFLKADAGKDTCASDR